MALMRRVRLKVEWRSHRKGALIEVSADDAESLIRNGWALPAEDDVAREPAMPALLTRKSRGKVQSGP